MRRIFAVVVFLLFSLSTMAQLEGSWFGKLDVFGNSLSVVIHLTNDNAKWSATMDSPDQHVSGIPVAKTTVKGTKVALDIKAASAQFEGTLQSNDSLIGTFKQGGFTFPLRMGRLTQGNQPKTNRPQTPSAPFSYTEEEVKVWNEAAGIHLAGSLTIPREGQHFPAVVMITGSGPQDRNESLLGHQPFWVIADFLSSNGIAVLRMDDRGVGASEGKFDAATSADFATDIAAAVDFLAKDARISPRHIGLIGHSEGGMIAPMVAKERPSIHFVVLLAGPGIPIDSLLGLQILAVAKAEGTPEAELQQDVQQSKRIFELLRSNASTKEKQKAYDKLIKELSGKDNAKFEALKQAKSTYFSPWFLYFINFNPHEYLNALHCHVLALNGTTDVQVTANENLAGIRNSLVKREGVVHEFHALEAHNHLFQRSETGAVSEYGKLEETFSPLALEVMLGFIQKVVQ